MAVLEIIKYPDERLKRNAEPVQRFDATLREFVAELEQTMRSSPGGIGIAATQVGHLQRVVIVDISARPKHKNHGRLVLINPEITEWSGMSVGREGCLSVPEFTGNVIRAKKIALEAYDEHGKPHQYQCEGYEARAIQHEVDHLDGFLFLDRLVSRRMDLIPR